MNVAHLARVDLSFGMGMCENKCESDRDSLLIVVNFKQVLLTLKWPIS